MLYLPAELKEAEKIKEVIRTKEEIKEDVREEIKKVEREPDEKKQETKPEKQEVFETGKTRIRIIKNIPAIIGSDMVRYELKENDEVEMPEIDAEILIENGIAIRL